QSRSVEKYKSKEGMQLGQDVDWIKVMGEWMIENEIGTPEEVDRIKSEAKEIAREGKNRAWATYRAGVDAFQKELNELLEKSISQYPEQTAIRDLKKHLDETINPFRSDLVAILRRLRNILLHSVHVTDDKVEEMYARWMHEGGQDYHTHLYSENAHSALRVPVVPPQYRDDPEAVNGYQVLNTFFD